MSEGTFGNPTIVEFKTDILIIGGGMAACGAAFEVKRWAGDDVKVTLVDKAAMDRSGAVARASPRSTPIWASRSRKITAGWSPPT